MKKIFALVLSLCLVLSSFVAVSAAEQVYNEGVYNEGVWQEGTKFDVNTVSAGNDFEDGLGTMFVGDTSLTTAAVAVDGRNALKVDYAGTNAYTTVVGFEFKDAYGNNVDLYDTGAGVNPDSVINWSIDVKMEDTTSAAPVLVLRDGANPPSGQSVNLGNLKTEVNGEWVTYSGSRKIGELQWAGNDATWTNLTVRFYPSAAGTMYIDNMSATIEEKSYFDEIGAENKTLASAGLEYGPEASSVSYADGYANATLTGTGNNSMVGTWLRNTDGTKYVPQVGDEVVWSVDINPSANFTLYGGTARGVIIRTGGAGSSTSLTPSGNYQRLTTEGSAPANTWTSLSGSYIIPSSGFDVSGWTGICIRTEFAGSIKVRNLSYQIRRATDTVVEEGWIVEPGYEVEPGWEAPDFSIDYVPSKSLNNIGTLENGVFTALMDEIEAHNNGQGNCSYQPWVSLATNIPAGTNFTVSYDLTTEGINNSQGDAYGVLTVRTRFYNASNTEINSSYRPYASVAVNTGEPVRYTLTVDPTQLSQDVASVRLVLDVDAASANKKNDEGAYFSFSNISVEEDVDTKLTYAKDGANLKITNNNADKYKFTGRVFFAEYDGKELIQFYAAGNVEEELEAGESVVIANGFEDAVSKIFKIFVWETDSLSPAMDVIE